MVTGTETIIFTRICSFFFSSLIKFTERPETPMWYGVLLALMMFIASELSSLLLNNYYYLMYRVGTRVQSVLTAAVYSKVGVGVHFAFLTCAQFRH